MSEKGDNAFKCGAREGEVEKERDKKRGRYTRGSDRARGRQEERERGDRMPAEEPIGRPKRALSYSPSRSPASARLYGAPSGRQQRSTPAAKKPPEPLRRVVADCLSPSAPSLLYGNPSAVASEAARTLRVSNLVLVFFLYYSCFSGSSFLGVLISNLVLVEG